MKTAIAYTRVSTARRGRSGLGLEAQQAALARFCGRESLSAARDLPGAETGKGADTLDRRPQLAVALKSATGDRRNRPAGHRRWIERQRHPDSPCAVHDPFTFSSSPSFVNSEPPERTHMHFELGDWDGDMLSKEYLDTARTLLRIARNMTDQTVADRLEAVAKNYERLAEKTSHADAAKALAPLAARGEGSTPK